MCAPAPADERAFAGDCRGFFLGEATYTPPNVLQEGGHSLPVWVRRSLHHLCTLWIEPPFPQEHALQLQSGKTNTLPKLNSLSSTYCLHKTGDHQFPLAPQSIIWRGFLSPILSQPIFLFFFLFFSVLKTWLPTLCSRAVFLSLNSLSHTLHLSHCVPSPVEILPILTLISWVFHMIWPQQSYISEARVPLLLCQSYLLLCVFILRIKWYKSNGSVSGI